MLRALAADLRKEAARRDRVRQEKAATVLVAASGLGLLGRKLGVSHG
jgi:hypothetical protein